MLPISSDYPVEGYSPVTWTIIVLCSVVAVLELVAQPPFSSDIFLTYGVHPALAVYDLYPLNADSLAVAWSLVTSMFVHAGIWHVVGNMLFFHCFSMPVESLMGPWRYTLFYFLCGIASGMTYALMNPASSTPVVGASGAVAGVLAAHTVLLPWTKVNVAYYGTKSVPAWMFTGLWLLLQFVTAIDEGSNVAWQAHLGGIAAGLMLAPLFSKPGVLVMAPTPGTDDELEHGKGFKIPTAPAAALAALLFVSLGIWTWGLQTDIDRTQIGKAGEWIALARLSGTGVPYDPERGLQRYREAARDNKDVAVKLAEYLHDGGMGLTKSEAESMDWYRSAAERGQPKAMEIYGMALVEGRPPVAADPGRGTDLLMALARKGYSTGDLQLGLILENGIGGAQVDLAGAARHYEAACDSHEWQRAKIAGVEKACYRLAMLLFKGRGVPVDLDRARKLLLRASNRGVAAAQNAQALLLLTGDPESREIGTVPGPNDAEARRLLESAASAGLPEAKATLALLNNRPS